MQSHFLKLAVVLVLAMPLAAQAVPTVLANGNINNLELDGSTYNVEWIFGAVDPVAGDFSLFTGNAAFADLFMTEVLSAFAGAGFIGVAGQRYFGVDYANVTGVWIDNISGAFNKFNGPHALWSSFPEAGFGRVSRVVAVPEPGTLSLLAVAMVAGGLGFAGRRRAANA